MLDFGKLTDTELIRALNKHEQGAFTEIYCRYWKPMLKIAWSYNQRAEAAKDVVHDVFISLWERKSIPNEDNLPGYLATAVKFQCFKIYQKELRRSQLASENVNFNEQVDYEAEWDAAFTRDLIDNIVEEMPSQCKLIFRYSRIEGLSNREIAQKINISEKGVENTLGRALKIIRSELKHFGLGIVIHLIISIFTQNL